MLQFISMAKVSIPRDKIEVRTSRSGGAGGQHVNKVSSKVELRFHLDTAEWIPKEVRGRIQAQFASRVTKEGMFLLSCEETRSQITNLELAFERLANLIDSCWVAPKKRVKTKPSKSSKEKRLQSKKLHSQKKQNRKDYN